MNYSFKVESGVPFKGRRPESITPLEKMYPIAEMNVGDSFFVDNDVIRRPAVQVGFHRINKRNPAGMKFRVARVTENDVIGSRVWRIA